MVSAAAEADDGERQFPAEQGGGLDKGDREVRHRRQHVQLRPMQP